jgi:alkylation response protein AidB-like acyl-CoA dehydrogenase
MDDSLTEEQQMLKRTVADVLGRFEPKREQLQREIFKEKKFPRELWNAMAEIGIMGCLVPEEYGGNGMGLLPMALAVDEMGKRGLGNALMVVTAMDTACIVRNASEEVKKRFLPDIASGKSLFCFAITEPDAGSNAFRITTRATRDGSVYRLNGQKVFITGTDVADYLRTTTHEELKEKGLSKAHGMSLFIVDTKANGFDMRTIPTRGIAGMTQWHLFFDDVEIPAENLVGEPDQCATALFNSLNIERILAGAIAVGTSDYLIRRAVDYAKERKVFQDRPIGSYQAISHPLAELKAQTEAARLMTYQAARAFDRDEDPADVGAKANMAKLLAAEVAIHAADQAIETFGGYGFSEEYGIIYYWENMRLLRTAPVTKEMILNFIAEHVLGLPRSY